MSSVVTLFINDNLMIDCQPDASKTFSGVQWAQCLNTHPLYLDTGVS